MDQTAIGILIRYVWAEKAKERPIVRDRNKDTQEPALSGRLSGTGKRPVRRAQTPGPTMPRLVDNRLLGFILFIFVFVVFSLFSLHPSSPYSPCKPSPVPKSWDSSEFANYSEPERGLTQLPQDAPGTIPHPLPHGIELEKWATPNESPYAFVFYASDPTYACAALQMVHQLSVLSPGIPTILMVSPALAAFPANTEPPIFPAYEDLKPNLRSFERYNTKIIILTPPPLSSRGGNRALNKYYASSLLKLLSFSLHTHIPQLRRIVVLDADQTVLKPLDHLFLLPPAEIAAPAAYWLGKPGVTSTLLVISLSDALWEEMKVGLRGIRGSEYDMDLVNRMFFPRRMMVLPGIYCTLNSHWGESDSKAPKKKGQFVPFLPPWSRRRPEALEVLRTEEAMLVHYSSGGSGNKPWRVDMEKVRQQVLKHEADPWFETLFEQWRDDARKMCIDGELILKALD
ncbi:nucleotide-diphospho-sugar transferase [Coprinopsis sp. MPI-PUGE-AT-0042]|nr:nucleotide-diphospho-sugar transferase [Coprinopsis sp. MPI-PUGE-AT-0042]